MSLKINLPLPFGSKIRRVISFTADFSELAPQFETTADLLLKEALLNDILSNRYISSWFDKSFVLKLSQGQVAWGW